MNRTVLELNDLAIGLYDHNGVIIDSPAYVMAQGREPIFGQAAQQHSRLQPLSVNNEFWHRLGVAPLSRPLVNFRHYADAAYAHLVHLAHEAGFEQPQGTQLIVAAPASFSREQLAVLSGVLRQSPFETLSIVDSALVVASQMPEQGGLLYIDLELHQLDMTRLDVDSDDVRRGAFEPVPGAGWIGFSNTLVQLVTDAFIAQSRFNPQHSAVWEQQLYNELPQWLQQIRAGQAEVLLSIDTGRVQAQARISRGDVLGALQPAFRKIAQHLERFTGQAAMPVLLSTRADLIPGLAAAVGAAVPALPPEPLADLVMRLPPTDTGGQGIAYVSALARVPPGSRDASARFVGPAASSVSNAASDEAHSLLANEPGQETQPTHLLYRAQAWPLPLVLRMQAGKLSLQPLSSAGEADLVIALDEQRGARLLPAAGAQLSVQLNGAPVKDSVQLNAGDRISLEGSAEQLQCIRVRS